MITNIFGRTLVYRWLGTVLFFCLIFVSILYRVETVEAVANPLDVLFGNGGKIIYDIGGISTTAATAALQPDGKIVVVGTAQATGPDFFTVSRYNANGTLDTSFSGDGLVVDTFSNSTQYSRASSVAIQPDGKIIVAGLGSSGAKTAFGIARFNADGSFDTTFDGDGRANISVSPNNDNAASSIALQPDGKIVIGGYIYPTASNYFPAVARINPNGSLDTSFSDDGIISYTNTVFGVGKKVFVRSDGKIDFVMSGHLGESNSIFRYNSNGSPDTTFDGDGRLEGLPGTDSVVFQPDGKIVIGGTYVYISDISSDFIVYRLNADGLRDQTFGTNGEVRISFGDALDNLGALNLQQDGKIVVAGTKFNGSQTSNTGDFAIARLNTNGSLDSTFGTGGKTVTPVGEANDYPSAVLLQPNGKIVVAGNTTRPNNINFRRGVVVTYAGDLNAADFDGDTRTDISIFRPSSGEWWLLNSSNFGNSVFRFGNADDKLTPGDFTGDGRTDVAVFRPSTGEWFILRSENGSFYSFPFGATGDIPVAADFDGDGRTDAAVFRPSNATWYISNSSGSGTTFITFGQAGDIPQAADYDGDGKTDIAIFRPSAGEWWIQRSSDLTTYAFRFGVSSDKPVPGDYTGDGKADTAFFRPSTGEWFILRSENSSFYSVPFGTAGDQPAPGDYDGDGRFDTAVFRPSSATWFVNRSTAGIFITNFGSANDIPVSLGY